MDGFEAEIIERGLYLRRIKVDDIAHKLDIPFELACLVKKGLSEIPLQQWDNAIKAYSNRMEEMSVEK